MHILAIWGKLFLSSRTVASSNCSTSYVRVIVYSVLYSYTTRLTHSLTHSFVGEDIPMLRHYPVSHMFSNYSSQSQPVRRSEKLKLLNGFLTASVKNGSRLSWVHFVYILGSMLDLAENQYRAIKLFVILYLIYFTAAHRSPAKCFSPTTSF